MHSITKIAIFYQIVAVESAKDVTFTQFTISPFASKQEGYLLGGDWLEANVTVSTQPCHQCQVSVTARV